MNRECDDRTSVVVITHNRRTELLRTLARLERLPERPRILVTDNASTDGTAQAVAHRPQPRRRRPEPGGGAGHQPLRGLL
jgi:GT2 family glycosyltransferase